MTAIRINGIDYTKTDAGYCYRGENGKQVRIKAAEFDAAYNEWTALEAAEAKAKAEAAKAADDKKAEDAVNKKAKKRTNKRISKDIAWGKIIDNTDVSLTAKQVDFIKHIPDTCFYENGLESTPWCDVLADEIRGQFAGKPMTVGAMISTIREKGLIYVAQDRVNGKKCKFFGFTELGKKVAAELGLN